jgi:hypothetical protein
LEARSILYALGPDNEFKLKGLKVKGGVRGRIFTITVHCERGIPSLMSSLEDIFACMSVAEEGLSSIKEPHGSRALQPPQP